MLAGEEYRLGNEKMREKYRVEQREGERWEEEIKSKRKEKQGKLDEGRNRRRYTLKKQLN